MKKVNKITVASKANLNMSNPVYVQLHNRMYTLKDNDGLYICLYNDSGVILRMSITSSSFDEFNSWSLSPRSLVNLFAALCVKFGECPF